METPPIAPSPLGGTVLTLGAWALMFSAFLTIAPAAGNTPALAVGATLGFGLVGTFAARMVAPPAELRLGLCGFAPALGLAVVLLLPSTFVLSEIDNCISAGLERPFDAATDESPAAETLESDTPESRESDVPGRAEGEESETPRPDSPTPSLPEDWLVTLEWALFAVALRPVLEEFFFRGVIQQGMVAQLGAWRGVLSTALLFAAVRASFGLGNDYALATLGVQALLEGLLLGLLRLASGSILPGIALQAGVAATGIAGLVLAEKLPIAGYNTHGDHTPVMLVFASAVCVGAGTALAARAAAHREPLPPPPPPESENGPL